MTTNPTDGPQPTNNEPAADRSVRPVIEHALADYGYSPDTARALVDMLVTEARAE